MSATELGLLVLAIEEGSLPKSKGKEILIICGKQEHLQKYLLKNKCPKRYLY